MALTNGFISVVRSKSTVLFSPTAGGRGWKQIEAIKQVQVQLWQIRNAKRLRTPFNRLIKESASSLAVLVFTHCCYRRIRLSFRPQRCSGITCSGRSRLGRLGRRGMFWLATVLVVPGHAQVLIWGVGKHLWNLVPQEGLKAPDTPHQSKHQWPMTDSSITPYRSRCAT